MPKIVMTRGIPGSGKSTFAKEWLAESPETRVRVNRDGIRWTQGIRHGNGTKEQEETVTLIERAIVTAALAEGKDAIIDSMNLNNQFTKAWLKLGYPVEFADFPTPLAVCIERDAARNRTVGEAIIRKIAKRYRVSEDGRLPSAPRQPEIPVFAPYVRGTRPAYTFDIDGTLAKMTGRSPYDTSRYMEDVSDRAISSILWGLQDADTLDEITFIGLSGRSDEFHDVTVEWMKGWGIRLDFLLMRSAGDFRNDAIVKSELVDTHLSGNYDVIAHFDDRNRVVDALRAKGIKVLQVEPGDF